MQVGCCFSTRRCFQMYTDMSDATFLYVSLLRKLALNKPDKGKKNKQHLKVEETSAYSAIHHRRYEQHHVSLK